MRRIVTGVVLVAVIGLPRAVPAWSQAGGSPFDGDPATTERLDAATPADAAVRISQLRFGDEAAQVVVLSRDDTFADSLAGAVLTGAGPLLLTPTSTLSPAARTELDRVLPSGGRVYLLGGEAALSATVESGLLGDGYDVVRLAGATRVETSVAVAEEVRAHGGDLGTVMLARADGPADNPTAAWADSVTGGAWSASTQTPILLTPTAALHPDVADAVARFEPQRTVLLGGTVALNEAVRASVPNPQRVAGAERAATAAAIARDLWGPVSRYIVMNGWMEDGWAYGLAAAGLAADTGAPLLLTQADTVPIDTLRQVAAGCEEPAGFDVVVVGTPQRISAAATDLITSVDGGPCPDLTTVAVVLPPGEREVTRAVSPPFVVVYSVGENRNALYGTGSMHVYEQVGSRLFSVARAPSVGDEYVTDIQVDAIGHVLLTLAFGAHSGSAYVWGFEGGLPRLYPSAPDGFLSVSGVALFDLNGDGILELRVYDNDYDPCYACGTTTWIEYGWTGAGYEPVGGSPPLPLPPTPEAAVDGLLVAWRASNIDVMYGYASGGAVYQLLEADPPMQNWTTECREGFDWPIVCYAGEVGGSLDVELSLTPKQASSSWHIVGITTTVF